MSTSADSPTARVGTVSDGLTTVSSTQRPWTVPELLREGQAAHGAAMVVRALPSVGGEPQRAVVASRKVGGAVARNRAKRRLREAIRAAGVPADVDVVVVARTSALSVPMTQLVAEAADLVSRVRGRLHAGARG